MAHAGRIDVAAAAPSLLSALNLTPFDVILLRDRGCSIVALEVCGVGDVTIARPTVCGLGSEKNHRLKLHPVLEEFLLLMAKERRSVLTGQLALNTDVEIDRSEIERDGGNQVPVSIFSVASDFDCFGAPFGQSNTPRRSDAFTTIEGFTFTAEKVDVSCVPDGQQLLLSIIFIHCDDPSLNKAFHRLCRSNVVSDSALIRVDTQNPNDGSENDERLMGFLEQGLESRVVVEGDLLVLALPSTYKDDRDEENMVFLEVGKLSMRKRADTDTSEAPCKAPATHETVQNGAVYRLGSVDQFAIEALDSFTDADANSPSANSQSATIQDTPPSSNGSNLTHDFFSDRCPGYESLVQELVALASIGDRRAASSAVVLTGCAGVGKSRLARHLVTFLSAGSRSITSVAKVVSAKDILLAAASSSLEDLKAFILKCPEESNTWDSRTTHSNITESKQTTRSLLIIDDLDIFVDADSGGEEQGILRDSERLVSIHAIGGAIDELVRFGTFGSGRKAQSNIHAPFIVGICGASPVQLPAEIFRVGRMEKVVAMPPPTHSQREHMLEFLFSDMLSSCSGYNSDSEQNMPSPGNVACRWAAACAPVTSGCVAADLQRICVDAVTRASSNSKSTASERCKDKSFAKLEHSASGVISKFRGPAVVSWDDVREATRSCIPSQLAQLEVSMGNTYMQESIIPGHQVDHRKLHDLSWQKFGGYDDMKARLYRTVVGPWRRHASMPQPQGISVQNPASPRDMSLQIAPPSGVLFHGGPGVGKTFAAHCLASSLGLPVVKVRASDVLDQWLGGSEAAIRSLFERARAASPSILFFDEIDALAINREDDDGSTDVHSRVLSTLLNEIDGVTSDSGKRDILVIAATNRLQDIDAALLRPGRLEEHILLQSPSAKDTSAILEIHLSSVPRAANVSIEELSESLTTAGASGADIEGICNEACMSAIHQLSDAGNPRDVLVFASDFVQAIQQWKT